VRFRIDPQEKPGDLATAPDGVIEQILPRQTVLTRADSFKAISSHPIVANADQVLIVAAVSHPQPKWGLIDRRLIAARAGKLAPIICLNKIDLIDEVDSSDDEHISSRQAIAHYASLGITTIETSADAAVGIDRLRDLLRGKQTVLAGHSGVGKSSLLRAVQPTLDIRIGEVSEFTQKGRHTTTSAQRHVLEVGGAVIDTPGVKVFGLWNVTRENLVEYFPDVEAETAPQWRIASYQRILKSLPAYDRARA
jgi:ribosome biogenesis GTPase